MQYLLNNYILGNFIELEVIQKTYEGLTIEQIATSVYTIDVPQTLEGKATFDRLLKDLNFVTEPTLYGLSSEVALGISNISQFHEYPYGELRGKGILMGFVDTGIDYNNPLFKNADNTTRIVALWDQTIPGNPPKSYTYGTVYTEQTINEALQTPNPSDLVPSQDEEGHGTFLAGIAAGNDQTGESGYVGGAPDSSLVIVKLRQARPYLKKSVLVEPDALAFQDNDIIAGINFLIEIALQERRPLVICLGLGTTYGAHNGTEIIENYINNLTLVADLIFVMAAGNEASSGHHYKGRVESGQSQSLEINVGEDEQGVTLYMWVDIPNRLEVEIKSPLGQVIERVPILSNKTQRFKLNLEETTVTITYVAPDYLTGGEKVGIRLDKPTPGLWMITVYAKEVLNGVFHMWLPRQGFISSDTRFLKPDPETSLEVIGTQQYGITVGGYDYLDESVYVASGRGPTTQNLIKPDLIAPSVNIKGPLPGGGFTTYVGTSAAAAITASAAALLMEWAVLKQNLPEMNTRIARSLLVRGAVRQPDTFYPNPIEGYGRLDLQRSIMKA